MNQITPAALEDMIARRVLSTGETHAQAKSAILAILTDLNEGKYSLDVVDDDGGVIGVRDKDGYHPNAADHSRRGRA